MAGTGPLTISSDSWPQTVMYGARAGCLLQFPDSHGFVKNGEGVEEIPHTLSKCREIYRTILDS